MNLVFLPATESSNEHYGRVPSQIEGHGDVRIESIQYPDLVWYNRRVRDEAIAQIVQLNLDSIVLVGFSKSGLGAWNLARTIPELIAGTIIFDSPVARQSLPRWGTAPFYDDDAAWQEDLPLNTMDDFIASVSARHQLVLISGPGFHDEMAQLSTELETRGSAHTFLARPELTHHWNSGWIEEALAAMAETGGAA